MRQYPSSEGLRVRADPHGQPVAFVWHGATHRVVTIEDVREPNLDWWSATGAIHRLYFVVTTNLGLICELYHDLAGDSWHLSRTFD